MMTQLSKLALAVAGLGLAVNANALSINGLDFTAVGADVTLTSLTGSGTEADPYVLGETVHDLDVTVAIRGLPNHGNTTQSGHTAGFRLRKVIKNDTGGRWTFYDNELQESLGTPSPDGDGLSFGQGAANQRPFTGDLLPTVIEIDLPRDYVNFSGGEVPNGGTLTIEYTISDNSPLDIFYLRQRPNVKFDDTRVPELGATLWLLGASLAGLSAVRRKA